ncbi:MAG: ABC transporter ATP-binding protein [Thermoplasmata archaeon]
MAFIEVKNLTKIFKTGEKETVAFENISFSMVEREFISIVGPSGCGKSTILRILIGLDTQTSGEILYKDLPLPINKPKFSIVFQTPSLFPWLTVQENIEVVLEAMGIKKEERTQIVEKYIKVIGLDGFENAYPKELSGGMRQRVGIARALAVNPELLLLDEPFSALDSFTAEGLREEILMLWSDPSLPPDDIILVTHNIDEAVQLSDRVIILSPRPGHIIGEIKIDLPRPRNNRSSEFYNYVDKVITLLSK